VVIPAHLSLPSVSSAAARFPSFLYPGQGRKALVSHPHVKGPLDMLRDWLLTLLVLSPTFLALVIVLFVLLKRVARHQPIRSTGVDHSHHIPDLNQDR
jgi:hypothetical protein